MNVTAPTPTLTLRPAAERGRFDHGWLDARHTFSFGGYRDPAWMGFRSLRVMNEDRIAPGMGFGEHPHRDMEILTYILDGALAHHDSLGHAEALPAGSFQYMSAGSGIEHSEFNASDERFVHLYQIWILPAQRGLKPAYGQLDLNPADAHNRWQVVAAPIGHGGALPIRQDAIVKLARLESNHTLSHELSGGRGVWVQVLRGKVTLNGAALAAGDGAAAEGSGRLELRAGAHAEVLLFDLA
ncbi:MAG: pirin family protein [Planctomycetes bacterium]|nr:pirin family protein [Planctomycetota bacterium]